MKPTDFKYTYLGFDQRRTDMTDDGSVYAPMSHARGLGEGLAAAFGVAVFIAAVVLGCVALGG